MSIRKYCASKLVSAYALGAPPNSFSVIQRVVKQQRTKTEYI